MTDKLRAAAGQALDYIRSTADYKMGHPAACEVACDLAEALAEQPAKQPLTDEQIEAAVASVSVYRGEYAHAIARAIEAAHGIK